MLDAATRPTTIAPRIDSLLSSRLFLAPQLVDDRLYFISNLGGAFSLFVTDANGSVPEPLLPPHIALQNPELMEGESFAVFPELDTIVVMLDQDGDEHYQPMRIPLDGGFPEDLFGDRFAGYNVYLTGVRRVCCVAPYLAVVAQLHCAGVPFRGLSLSPVSRPPITELSWMSARGHPRLPLMLPRRPLLKRSALAPRFVAASARA